MNGASNKAYLSKKQLEEYSKQKSKFLNINLSSIPECINDELEQT